MYDDYDDFGQPPGAVAILVGLGAALLGVLALTRFAKAQQPHNLEVSVTFGGNMKPGLDNLQKIGKRLKAIMGMDACPGAPKVKSIIRRTAPKNVDVSGAPGMRVVYEIDAKFATDPTTGEMVAFDPDNAFLRDQASACIFTQLKAIDGIGGRIVGIRAKRVA